MKKKLIAALLSGTFVFSALFTGCGSTDTADTSDAAAETSQDETESETVSDASSDAIEKKVFRIGIECTYAPYNWTQETDELANGATAVEIANSPGSYTYGYDVALAQMICDELGWELEVYKSDWTSIFMGLEDKTYDCIMSAVCYTEERDEIYDFTSCYYERQIKAVVREDSEYASITGLSQFDGMNPTVIAQLGTNFVDYKEQIPTAIDGTDYEAAAELFLAIQNQTADVLITELSTAESALNSMSGLVMLDLDEDDNFVAPEGSPNTCCILFRGDDELRDIIQGAMDDLGWTNETEEGLQAMNDLMSEMIAIQPSNN
ncbi:MAG: transporter substrate-binding domain-containing protein [Clostridiales bacterium]|nr:transporter substrate-binding domain-containing protein [Clostridiales bacterium]